MAKRLFDLFFSIFILLLFLPLGIVISLLILFGSSGGVFYKQERIGKNSVPFQLFKFRTMKPDSDKKGHLTVGMKDPRITKIGFFLRKYKIDEFPQFLNVIRGEMSVVGPRPEVKEFVDIYTDEQKKVLTVKPGITDFASLEYFDENRILGESLDPQHTYISEIMPHKLKLNLSYVANASLKNDLLIIFRTVLKIMK